jgi:hypothetical protein
VKRQKAVRRGHAREGTIFKDKHTKEYANTVHLVITENSIQPLTTKNLGYKDGYLRR